MVTAAGLPVPPRSVRTTTEVEGLDTASDPLVRKGTALDDEAIALTTRAVGAAIPVVSAARSKATEAAIATADRTATAGVEVAPRPASGACRTARTPRLVSLRA